MPLDALKAGVLVLVRPGASVPAGGVVKSGESDVDESMITGESRPVPKSTGAKVVAGTVSGSGSLRVEVTGTDVAVQAGDVVLVRSDPRAVPRNVALSKATWPCRWPLESSRLGGSCCTPDWRGPHVREHRHRRVERTAAEAGQGVTNSA